MPNEALDGVHLAMWRSVVEKVAPGPSAQKDLKKKESLPGQRFAHRSNTQMIITHQLSKQANRKPSIVLFVALAASFGE